MGGDEVALRQARPFLEASSKEIIEIGKVGDATDNESEQLKGKAQELKGKAQQTFGKGQQKADENT